MQEQYTLACDVCGRARQVSKNTYQRIQAGTRRNRCTSCAAKMTGSNTERLPRRVNVTCAKCGKEWSIDRGYYLDKLRNRTAPILCRSCAQKEHKTALAGRERVGNKLAPRKLNGRRCRDCGKPLSGPWWYRCAACWQKAEYQSEESAA